MSCGMVRKIDELGRVVLPKEMRRVLNIKTGSSVEMVINEKNQIVLNKFSEIENVLSTAKILGNLLYEKLNLKCLICDDDNVLCVFGHNKKEFVHKRVVFKNKHLLKKIKICDVIDVQREDLVDVYEIKTQGYSNGFIVIWDGDSKRDNIEILVSFFNNLIDD